MPFYSLYYNIISLTSLTITQGFHLLFGFAENQVRNSVQITEGLDNGDSDNRGPTVLTCLITLCYRSLAK